MYDIAIIGAGIIGSFLAYDLSRYQLNIIIIDKANDIANGTTMANSAIIHTGYDPKDNTLKATLNQRGACLYNELRSKLDFTYQKCGSYVVATSEDEINILYELKKRADERKIQNSLLEKDLLLLREPNIADGVVMGLEFPDTAIIYPWEVAIALMEEAVLNGAALHLGEEVIDITRQEDHFTITTNKGLIPSKIIINAAGIHAKDIGQLIEAVPFKTQIKRGEYFVLSKKAKGLIDHIIFPAPSNKGKGVLAVPTVHGNILLGPTSDVIEEDDNSTTAEGLAYIRENLTKTIKNVPYGEVIRSYSGLRAAGNDGDFYIKPSCNYPSFIYAACIDSPGLASAPAISEYIIKNYIGKLTELTVKKQLKQRQKPLVMAKLDDEKKNEIIKKDPRFGKIVCKCENISYGEIVEAIHAVCGAKTIKGIKKRVRPGMGKCQGGFCEVEVAKIIAKELNIPLSEVLYDEPDSALGKEAK